MGGAKIFAGQMGVSDGTIRGILTSLFAVVIQLHGRVLSFMIAGVEADFLPSYP